MLEKFSVTNFKNFNQKLTLDFTASDYQFNPQSIKDNIVKTAIVYGTNASGKSNLGFAIFDIVQHLTDNESRGKFYRHYLTKSNGKHKPYADFEYCFKFKNNKVVYQYQKINHEQLGYECLTINDKEVLSVARNGNKKAIFSLKGAENLSQDITKANLSIIKYVRENAILAKDEDNAVFEQFCDFINKMLFFRSLEYNDYLGLEKGSREIDKDIIDRGHIKYFEEFLNEAGIECKLNVVADENGEERIVFDFDGEYINFFEIASQGTKSVTLFYYWYQRIQSNKTSFIFIDEFDAFYHHNLSEFIVKKLQEIDVQAIFTTHNTSIMSNDLSRPDCYFVLDNNNITAINKLTDQELRKAHNLQKLYKAHAFEQ